LFLLLFNFVSLSLCTRANIALCSFLGRRGFAYARAAALFWNVLLRIPPK
jgi:hypothetical protein